MLNIVKLPMAGEMLSDMPLLGDYREFGDIPLFQDDYKVWINGEECQVRACRVSAVPFNRIWPGRRRPLDQLELSSFVSFSSDEKVQVRIKSKRSFQQAVVRPVSKDIDVQRQGDELVFTLERCGQYVLELDGEHFALHLFFNPVRNYSDEEKKSATYYFGPGLHFEHKIVLKDNESLYVDENAVLYASIYGKDAKNIRIFGGGVIDGSCEERITESYYKPGAIGNIRLIDCKNAQIEDVILQNSAAFCCSFFSCNHVTVDNIKIIGQWRYNTDGIDPVSSSNVEIKNCFIRSFDDAISVKALYKDEAASENIKVDNCVIWCGWGSSLRIGPESFVKEYRNILFQNCDIIHHGHIAMDIRNSYSCETHHVVFENINVEFHRDTLPCIVQETDDMVYNAGGQKAGKFLIFSDNDFFGFEDDGRKMPDTHDITYKNIHVFLEEGMEFPDIHIVSQSNKVIHRNFLIDGLFVNGEKVEDLSDFGQEIRNIENLTIK